MFSAKRSYSQHVAGLIDDGANRRARTAANGCFPDPGLDEPSPGAAAKLQEPVIVDPLQTSGPLKHGDAIRPSGGSRLDSFEGSNTPGRAKQMSSVTLRQQCQSFQSFDLLAWQPDA